MGLTYKIPMSTKNLILLLVLVSYLLTSLSANAIRSVGNGGGLAEMRVVYLFQNLERFLRVCLTPANVCNISNETYLDWVAIFSEKPTEQIDYIVSFEIKLPHKNGYALDGLSLKISHKMLYVDLNTPKNFNELLAFVIAVKQDLLGSRLSFEENVLIASRIFHDMKIEEQSHKVMGVPSLLSLSQLKVFDGVTPHLIVGLEDEEKTINMSDLITKVLPCGEIAQWSFNQWSSFVQLRTLYFSGHATAHCNGERFDKRILLKASLTNKLLIDTDSVKVNFFTK